MTASTMQVRALSDAEWPGINAQFRDMTFEQSLTYGHPAAARIGAALRFAAVEEDSGICAAVALRLRRVPGLGRGIVWLPSGPLVQPLAGPDPDDTKLEGILAALRRQFCAREGHILRLRLSAVALLDPARVRAIAARAGFAPCPARPPYRSHALDLSQPPEALLRRLNGKWRTDLRFAHKSGLTLDSGTGPGFEARFLTLFDQVQAAKGFRPEITPQFHFDIFASHPVAPDYRLEILIATRAGQDLAGIVVATSGHAATYLYGATGEAGRPLRAGYFLTWEAILLARARGQLWYDLGGVDADANPDVARFKERMGGERIEAEVFQAMPKGPVPRLITGLEALRGRLKRGR